MNVNFFKPLLLLLTLPLYAQQGAVRLGITNSGSYRQIEKADLSRFENGKYIGHVYRETLSQLRPDGHSGHYTGTVFVMEETLRDLRQSALSLDFALPVEFSLNSRGELVLQEDNGYPALRGFPVFPQEAVTPGTKWVSQGKRAVNPRGEGKPVLTTIAVEYEYKGEEMYQNRRVHRIFARYAARYRGDFELQGSHAVDILIDAATGLPVFLRDRLDETYKWQDGTSLRYSGFTLTFGEFPPATDPRVLITRLGDSLGLKEKEKEEDATATATATAPASALEKVEKVLENDGIELVTVPEGIKLTVNDIRFVPDSAAFLPVERLRLDILSRALLQMPQDRTFLIE